MDKTVTIALALAALVGCSPQQHVEPQLTWRLSKEGVQVFDSLGKAQKLTIALPGWVWASQPYACPPDLAVGPRGEVLVTSNVLPVLWRIDPKTFQVTVHRLALDADNDKDVGFSKIFYSAGEDAYIAVSAAHGSAWRIDPMLRAGQKVTIPESRRAPCGGSKEGR